MFYANIFPDKALKSKTKSIKNDFNLKSIFITKYVDLMLSISIKI